jgi:hypothetical protein
LHLENVGATSIRLTTQRPREAMATITDENGEVQPVRMVSNAYLHAIVPIVLGPGETFALETDGLGFESPNTNAGSAACCMASCKPGRYSVHYALRFPHLSRAEDGDWVGVVETGVQEVTVAGEPEEAEKPAPSD